MSHHRLDGGYSERGQTFRVRLAELARRITGGIGTREVDSEFCRQSEKCGEIEPLRVEDVVDRRVDALEAPPLPALSEIRIVHQVLVGRGSSKRVVQEM